MRGFRFRKSAAALSALSIAGFVLTVGSCALRPPGSGEVLDEARVASRPASSFPAAGEDYFHDMDGGVALTADEVRGRDMWIVWTGGNDRFWDVITKSAFGNFDLLKIISSNPALKYSRDNRFKYFGVVNEPCFDKPTGPDPQRFGLWLDVRRADCAPDPFADATRNIPAWRSVPAARPCRSAPTMASRRGSSACACFPIRISMPRRRRSGIPSATTTIPATTSIRIWCGPIASACPAASATSAPIR